MNPCFARIPPRSERKPQIKMSHFYFEILYLTHIRDGHSARPLPCDKLCRGEAVEYAVGPHRIVITLPVLEDGRHMFARLVLTPVCVPVSGQRLKCVSRVSGIGNHTHSCAG